MCRLLLRISVLEYLSTLKKTVLFPVCLLGFFLAYFLFVLGFLFLVVLFLCFCMVGNVVAGDLFAVHAYSLW